MRRIEVAVLVLILVPALAHGQTAPPVSRADVAVSTGWFSADHSGEGSCCGWSAGLFKGASAGYYWTDHLKTETTLGDPGNTEGYNDFSERLANGTFRHTSERHSYTSTKLSISRRRGSRSFRA